MDVESGSKKVVQPPVELAEERAGIARKQVDFLDEHAFDRRDQRGMHAVAHDIADENAGLRVGKLGDGEEVAADASFGR